MKRAAALAALALVVTGSVAQAASCAPDAAILLTPDGREQRVTVEIADDAAERAQGLMYRKSLPPDHGMLFVYQSPQPTSFWMKNTLIPLDILFFDARGVLRHVHSRARPLDLTALPGALPGDPDPNRMFVLELAGGEAARKGLVPGTALGHPAVPQGDAARPCD